MRSKWRGRRWRRVCTSDDTNEEASACYSETLVNIGAPFRQENVELTAESGVELDKQGAKPLFSPRQIRAATSEIKLARPDLWEAWRKLEEIGDEVLYKSLMTEIRGVLSGIMPVQNLSEMNRLVWSIRDVLRREIGLETAPIFSDEQIVSVIKVLKDERYDLWEQWKDMERKGKNFHPIREQLESVIGKTGIGRNIVEMDSLLARIRQFVFVEAGVWESGDL